jgi:hypothetical protein
MAEQARGLDLVLTLFGLVPKCLNCLKKKKG